MTERINGAEVAYELRGEGNSRVVLLHGWGRCAAGERSCWRIFPVTEKAAGRRNPGGCLNTRHA